jgi:hypothetical protein
MAKSYDIRRAVARSQGLPAAPKAVLTALADHADWKTGRTFVGHDTIRAESGLSARTIIRAMQWLEQAGWITRERRVNRDGHRTSNLVTVHDPARAAQHQAAMLRLPLMRAIAGGAGQPVEHGDNATRLSATMAPRPKCHHGTGRKQTPEVLKETDSGGGAAVRARPLEGRAPGTDRAEVAADMAALAEALRGQRLRRTG